MIFSTKARAEEKFCFSRQEAENIYSCLKIKDQFEKDLFDTNPPITENETNFFNTEFGKIVIFSIGVGFGIIIERNH